MKNPTLTLTQLLANFQKVKKQGNGYQAKCPAHEDHKASLSIRQGDENYLVYCHAGCETRLVLEAVGLTLSDLFSTAPKANLKSIIVATYDYRDENGQLLYQTVRKEPKTFLQRRPDKNGKWIWKLDSVRRVLYRLPELLAADPQATVFICEGEKDADALRNIGLIATTSPQGAGKWRDEYSEHLQGREVVILPDNDTAGRKHADDVARSLYRIAASVKVLSLPNVPDKGDVSDWLKNGGDAESLCVTAENAPHWIPAATGDKPPKVEATPLVQTWGEFSAIERKRGEAIIHELERGEIGMLAAVTNVGKSTLLRNLAT